MRFVLFAAALLTAAPVAAQAPVRAVGTEGQALSVTIYNDDLALVQDVRPVTLPAGRSRMELRDVSAAIRPETVSLTGRGVEVVEQNFDFDLLTPAKMMEKAVGREVVVIRTNPGNGAETRETATVLAVNDGVVLRIGDRIEVLRDDGVPTRVIFDRVPENLRAQPTLTVTVDADGAGARETTLSYLTSGLGWKADYVALFDERAGRLDLQGWITLTNRSGTPFTDAEVQLVAGEVQTADDGYAGQPRPFPPRGGVVGQAGTETGEGGEALGDTYLYSLPEKTTVAQNQTKQVGFLEAAGVPARKVYEYRQYGFQTLEEPESASVVVQFANARAAGLGVQLPAGILRVYLRDQAGDPKFVGESAVPHTPQGSELSIKTGAAFDVTVKPTREKLERISLLRSRIEMSYLIRNARPQPVTVQIKQGGLLRGGRVLAESLKSRRVDSSTLAYDVAVPANGEAKLTFTVDNGW